MSILRYGRELAFATADIYAHAAETRGAWDARLEALVVDSVVRGDADETVRSRASALGLGRGRQRGGARRPGARSRPGDGAREGIVDDVRATAREAGLDALGAVHGDRLVVVARRRVRCRQSGRAAAARTSGTVRWSSARSSRTCCRRTSPPPRRSPGCAPPPGWPTTPALGHQRGPARRARARRRPARPAQPGRRTSTCPCSPPARSVIETLTAFLDQGGSIEGTGPGAVRPPEHRPLPAAPGRWTSPGLATERRPARLHAADRAGPRAARPARGRTHPRLCRVPTKARPDSS